MNDAGFIHIQTLFTVSSHLVERGSSVVECRTRNRESPGSNLFSKFGNFSRRLSPLSCINEYLAIDGGGNVTE